MSVTRGHGLGLCFAGAVAALLSASAYAGGPCPCDGNVDGFGGIDQGDYFLAFEAVRDPSICPTCDVNCDGTIDACDVAVIDCQITAGFADPACCAACGACCTDAAAGMGCALAEGGCRQTTEQDCLTGGSFGVCSPGTYNGDGSSCDPSPCDCNDNGIPDGDEIDDTTDCDGNGVLDACQFPDPTTIGACCTTAPDGTAGCANTDAGTCASALGVYAGDCTQCPNENLVLVQEADGSIFIHVIGPPVDCDAPAPSAAGCSPTAPKVDAWASPASGMMCYDFTSNPIAAGYFGPGSDPFTGTVCLEGLDLGNPLFPGADTLIERSADPFDRCDLPSATPANVDIEIVALSLESTAPITVTFNGGMNPENWDVFVDLSSSPQAPAPFGQLTATKEHCNGGTYTSILNVQPRFTFTPDGGGTSPPPIDTGLEGLSPVMLVQSTPAPWVTDVPPFVTVDPCSDFRAGLSDPNPSTNCDCQPNGVNDVCDPDGNGNGIPDACEAGVPIPTVSEWGLIAMTLLLVTGGTILFGRRRQLARA